MAELICAKSLNDDAARLDMLAIFENFGYIIERKREIHPKKVAIVEHWKNRIYTYEQLDQFSNKIANALLSRGAKKGDRVMSVTDNSIEFFGLLFASNKIGIILVPINFRLSPNEIKIIAQDVSPKFVIFQSEYSSKLGPTFDLLGQETEFIEISGNMQNANSFASLMKQSSDTSPGIHAGADEPNVILYTSGSTGNQKGVVQTHLNTFVKSVDLIVDLQPTINDVLLTMAPIFHVGGLNILTMCMFHVGGSVVLQNKFEPAQSLGIIQERRITLLFAIPTMLKMMITNYAWPKCDISSLRYVVSGGEPVPQKIKDEFGAKNIAVLSAYGLTEGTSMSVFQRIIDSPKSSDCIGKPPTHLECKIVDEAGQDIGINQVGELLHRGPTVTTGYWNKPSETNKIFRDGWLFTGDLAYKDKDGYYYLVGRRDEMIKSGGGESLPFRG